MVSYKGVSAISATIAAVLWIGLPDRSVCAQLPPEQEVKSLHLAEGLEATLWASEPMLVKPTNMDIDAHGRIWITEAANYRSVVDRPEGDRIIILEDTHHTGACDSVKVFVQDKSLFAPLGICIVGDKVYVAQSPNLLVYTIDASGDHPTGPPEILFTGFGGKNHDHGLHTGVVGPDGRYYFNCGNEGVHGFVKYGDGKPVVDILGSEIGRQSNIFRGKPKDKDVLGYQDGMAFRCNLDGSSFEVLADNFRNDYELCVDSFGTIWQSDNDDDGNQGVRITYVMEGGDFGYKGPKGTSWARDEKLFPNQTHQEAQWHQRYPGVVPNLLHTGAGSPTGIVCYEGNLLPEKYRGMLLHCDAGPNVVRAYLTRPSGAGYAAEPVEIVHGADRWFRPSDLCVAPDGALYVADWCDPGVGGHHTGDNPKNLHGRVYRIAPVGYTPKEVKLDLETVPGQIDALCSPNLATRYLAFATLSHGGEPAVAALKTLYDTNKNERLRARGLWLLALSSNGKQFVQNALKDPDSDIRVTALRAARQIKMDMVALSEQMLDDSSPAVLRELCIAMLFEPDQSAVPVLVKLADKWDGKDRWYLEAFGIGATGRESQVLEAWTKDHKNDDPTVDTGIEWRLKKEPTPDQPVPGGVPNPTIVRPVSLLPAGTVATAGEGTESNLPHRDFKSKDGTLLPPMGKLAKLHGDVSDGEAVFKNTSAANCVRCHQIGSYGNMVGPPLTAIGAKLSKPQLYEAILYPSAAIEMGYETWSVKTKEGDVLSGIKVEDTPSHVTLKDADAKLHDIPTSKIEKMVKQPISLMPEGLNEAMTQQDLVNLVEFLSKQKG